MNIMQKAAAGLAAFGASVGAAVAAVPESVTNEISTARNDALTVGAAVLGVIIAIFALKLVRRAL